MPFGRKALDPISNIARQVSEAGGRFLRHSQRVGPVDRDQAFWVDLANRLPLYLEYIRDRSAAASRDTRSIPAGRLPSVLPAPSAFRNRERQ